MSQKGGQYEREMCRRLSLWWTRDKRDDVFWRTKGSGGRATSRFRTKGKSTSYQHGDIYATDPLGIPLLDLLVIELKRGYGQGSVQDLLDRPPGKAQQQYDKFLQQTIEAHEAAGSFSWLMIVRKDKRQALVFMPDVLVNELKKQGCFKGKPIPFLTTITKVRFLYGKKITVKRIRISCMLLDKWLECVTPADIKELVKRN